MMESISFPFDRGLKQYLRVPNLDREENGLESTFNWISDPFGLSDHVQIWQFTEILTLILKPCLY